jgi:hypothetical protein
MGLLHRTAQIAEEYLATLGDRRVAASLGFEDMLAALDGPLPEHGEDAEVVLDALAALEALGQVGDDRAVARGVVVVDPAEVIAGLEAHGPLEKTSGPHRASIRARVPPAPALARIASVLQGKAGSEPANRR